MTLGAMLDKLEAGEIIYTFANNSVLYSLQILLDNNYHEAQVDVQIGDGRMSLTPVGKFIKKLNSEQGVEECDATKDASSTNA
jgi:hypothetical protein